MVSLWKAAPLLYNPKDPDYKKGKLRKKAMNFIATSIDRTEEQVLTHMNSMRTVYGKVLQLPKKARLTKRQQAVFNSCIFLRPYMRALKDEAEQMEAEEEENVDVGVEIEPSTSTCQSCSQLHHHHPATSSNYIETSIQTTEPNQPEEIRHSLSRDDDESLIEGSVVSLTQELGPIPITPRPQQDLASCYPPSETSSEKASSSSEKVESLDGDIPQQMPSQKGCYPPDVFWKQFGSVLAATVNQKIDIHVLWARVLAEKLKLIDPVKAEEFKYKVDGMILEFFV